MIRCYIRWERFGRLLLPLVVGCAGLMVSPSQAQTTLNVTNFGARGDAVQFFVNTTNNSVLVTTTTRVPISAVGDAIEVFGAGAQTSGRDSYGNNTNGNQDLVATITDVVNSTNIYISRPARVTLTNTFATYGHDNAANFQAAVDAASGTRTIINVPAGTYLMLSSHRAFDLSAWYSVMLRRGGISFIGEGTNKTILLGQGAWFRTNYLGTDYCKRGYVFGIVPPITNDYPVVFQDMTIDGGVQQGNTPIHGTYPNIVDGQGWDGSHGAIDIRGFSGPVFTHQLWTNVIFVHWRGEMVKSNDGSTNGNLSIINCVFRDGNATALNIYPSWWVTNCVFDNLFQVAEYYQKYSTNTSYFVNNLVTNISGNGFAINGGKGNNPPFVIQGNVFDFNTNSIGWNAILTTPGDNIYVVSNKITFESSKGICVAAGVPGYQGTWDNSNIVVRGNVLVNPSYFVTIGGGGLSQADTNKTEALEVYDNTLIQSNSGSAVLALSCYTYATNVWFHNNDFRTKVELGFVTFSSGNRGDPFALVDTNNFYYTKIYDLTGITNAISYANGSRFEVIYAFHPGTVYALTDTNASQIPRGAQMLIQNENSSSNSIPIYLNSALTRGPVSVDYGQTLITSWTNGVWAVHSSQPPAMDITVHVMP